MIDKNNIESYILASLDGELPADQLQALTAYMEHHPESQQMMEDYRKTIIAIDADLVYPNKAMLLKKETTFLQKMYIPIGIAAALLVMFFATMTFQNDEESALSKEHSIIATTHPAAHPKIVQPSSPATIVTVPTVASNISIASPINNSSNLTANRVSKISTTSNHKTNHSMDSEPTLTHKESAAPSAIKAISLIPMQPQIVKDYRLEYEVQITTAYIRLAPNISAGSTSDDEMDWKIASIPFQPSFSKIDNFIQKVERKKEQLFDKIALLTPLEL